MKIELYQIDGADAILRQEEWPSKVRGWCGIQRNTQTQIIIFTHRA